MEGIKKLKYEVGDINSRLSTISDRLSEPAYSKEFVDEFKKCCYRLVAPEQFGSINLSDISRMFGLFSPYKVLEMYSAEEIVEKFREFDEKKERDRTFLVGDEVEHTITHSKGIVLQESLPNNKCINIWRADGGTINCALKEGFTKTGRHFDSIDYWIETELKKEKK